MKKAIAILLTVCTVLICLSACGGKNDPNDPNQGVWKATTGEMFGLSMDVEELFGQGFTIELKANGKCALNVDGKKANGTWTLNDGAFTVKGGGIDEKGRLENGKLTLENVMGMGLTLIFEKEGGYPGGTVVDDPIGNGGTPPISDEPIADETTELQRRWNGTWYGFMYVEWGTGKYDNPLPPPGDMYMVVDIDADGKGTFTIYDHVLDEFMTTECYADEYGIYAEEGTCDYAYGLKPPQAYEWTLRPSSDESDLIETYASFIDYHEDEFRFSIYFKPWGDDWQLERGDGGVLPPGLNEYLEKIRNGEPSPFDGGSVGDDIPSAPVISTEPGLADVVVGLTFDELNVAIEAFGLKREVTTHNDVAAYLGVPGKKDDNHSSDRFSVSWYASDKGYVTVFFDKATGFYTSWSYSGYGRPDGWVEGFVPAAVPPAVKAALEAAAAAGDGGPISYVVDGVTITATLPAAGWSHMSYSSDYLYIYNVPDASKAYSNDPRISLRIKDNAEIFDFYLKEFENLKNIGGRTIGGIQMTGRTYKYVGMEWIEYIGKISDTRFVSIKISKIDVDNGEGKTVMDSIMFK